MRKVTRVEALPNSQLQVSFDDGVAGVIDLRYRLFDPVFRPLQDPVLFAQVSVDAFGAVCWPNGADLAPDGLYRIISDMK